MTQKDLDPIPPDAFDVDRPKPEEPVGYRDASPEIPERFGQVRGPVPRSSRSSGLPMILLAAVAVLLVGALFAMCGQHRRDLDRRHQTESTSP